MKMIEIKAKAKELGIRPGKIKKEDLIRTIQEKEGNFPCFGSAIEHCSQEDCSWREDCLFI
ncbi:MAG: SAP domain-containing protein [Proteobacteria bacterium]|nr:SAP domain-containing protein [Pseudomonadota bacterium]MBU4118724.1 SAP domain-containing protein [Pseudomonadota bacterium]